MICWLINCLTDWLIDCPEDGRTKTYCNLWSLTSPANRISDTFWINWFLRIYWLIYCLISWLVDWLINQRNAEHTRTAEWRRVTSPKKRIPDTCCNKWYFPDWFVDWLIDWLIDRLTRGLQNTDLLQCDVTNEENIKHISEQVKQQFNKLGRYFDICEKDFFEI